MAQQSKAARFVEKHKAAITLTLVGIAVWAFLWPTPAEEAASKDSSDGDLLENLLNLVGLQDSASNVTTVLEVQIQYQEETLELLGTFEAVGTTDAEFEAASTATAGSKAKFQLYCGIDRCGSAEAAYAEPATFFNVQVPLTEDTTRMTVTAGVAFLEVEF